MNEILLRITIVLVVIIIIHIIMDFKYENFIPEANYNILSLATYCVIMISGRAIFNFMDKIYDIFILIFALVIIIGTYIAL